jgi:hypothetical protein
VTKGDPDLYVSNLRGWKPVDHRIVLREGEPLVETLVTRVPG